MALGELQGILQALQVAHQKKMGAATLAAQQMQAQNAEKDRQARLKLESDRINSEHDYHQELLKTTQQQRKLQRTEALQKAEADIYSSGNLPSGSKFTQGDLNNGGTLQLSDLYNNDDGTPSSINVEPLQQHAQRIADLQRTLLAPKTEATMKEKAAADADAMDKLKEQRQFMMDQATQHEQAENGRTALMRSSMERIANIRANNSAGGVGGIDPDVFSGYVQSVLDGSGSIDKLKKLLPGAKNAPLISEINNEAMKHGVPITDKQQARLIAVQKLVDNVKYLDAAISEKPDSSTTMGAILQSPRLWGNSKFNSAINELQSNLPGMSVVSSISNRLSTPEMNAVGKAAVISPTSPKQTDIATRNLQYTAAVKAAEDAIPGASPQQRAWIKQKLGLDKVSPTFQMNQMNQQSQDKINSILQSDPAFAQQVPPQQTVQQ